MFCRYRTGSAMGASSLETLRTPAWVMVPVDCRRGGGRCQGCKSSCSGEDENVFEDPAEDFGG